MEKILIYPVRRLSVDNSEIFEIGVLNITPSCDKVIPGTHSLRTRDAHKYKDCNTKIPRRITHVVSPL